ncbi:MAG: hypothetical protein H0V31_01210 [Acidobacteria bacterium]|nr:hypothetical protein [Acidobacteriota bacterium]
MNLTVFLRLAVNLLFSQSKISNNPATNAHNLPAILPEPAKLNTFFEHIGWLFL